MEKPGWGADFGKGFGLDATKALVESRQLERMGRSWGADAMDAWIKAQPVVPVAPVAPVMPALHWHATPIAPAPAAPDWLPTIGKALGLVVFAALVYRLGSVVLQIAAEDVRRRRFVDPPDDEPPVAVGRRAIENN